MGNSLPVPSASWYLNTAERQAADAVTSITAIGETEWRGRAAEAFGRRLSTLARDITTFSEALGATNGATLRHERELAELPLDSEGPQ